MKIVMLLMLATSAHISAVTIDCHLRSIISKNGDKMVDDDEGDTESCTNGSCVFGKGSLNAGEDNYEVESIQECIRADNGWCSRFLERTLEQKMESLVGYMQDDRGSKYGPVLTALAGKTFAPGEVPIQVACCRENMCNTLEWFESATKTTTTPTTTTTTTTTATAGSSKERLTAKMYILTISFFALLFCE